jgi:hypothetical protein
MTGRTEIHPTSKERLVVYFCPTYLGTKSRGVKSNCLSYRISQSDAEALIFNCLKERGIDYDEALGNDVTENYYRRLLNVDYSYDEIYTRIAKLAAVGAKAFEEYLIGCKVKPSLISEYKKVAELLYGETRAHAALRCRNKGFDWGKLRKVIVDAEAAIAKAAQTRHDQLRAEHLAFNLELPTASEMSKPILRSRIADLEEEMASLVPQLTTLSDRLKKLKEEAKERRAEEEALYAEWPHLENTSKSEALQRLFTNVTLYWTSRFHPSPKRPTRKKKTRRSGRWSHELDDEKTTWGLTDNLVGSR